MRQKHKTHKKKIDIKLMILLILIFVVFFNVYIDVCFTKLNRININTDKLKEGESIKLLQISDVHNKKSMNSNQQLIDLVQQTQADIVLITGDLIDDNTIKLDNVYALVEGIAAINSRIYFVTGNHEWRGGLAVKLIDGLAQRGVTILDNKNEIVSIKGNYINLSGIADWTSGNQMLNKALKDMDESIYSVMLAHDPRVIYDYDELVPDLTLSGHTHGGQVRMPIAGAVVAPGQKLFPKLDKGIYNLYENKILYIDSGVGTSVFPIRFLNRSQASLITIE